MTQQFQQDRELGWDDTIQQDSTEGLLLPPGDYIFEVQKFERARYTPGANSKLPACNMAKLELRITTEQGTAIVFNNLYLHTSTEGLLSAFFSAIGQKRKGEPLQMNWNLVTGAKGAVKIKNREYKEKKYNEVDRFYPNDATYYENKEMPDIVKQLSQQNGGYQVPTQSTQQQNGYQPGQF